MAQGSNDRFRVDQLVGQGRGLHYLDLTTTIMQADFERNRQRSALRDDLMLGRRLDAYHNVPIGKSTITALLLHTTVARAIFEVPPASVLAYTAAIFVIFISAAVLHTTLELPFAAIGFPETPQAKILGYVYRAMHPTMQALRRRQEFICGLGCWTIPLVAFLARGMMPFALKGDRPGRLDLGPSVPWLPIFVLFTTVYFSRVSPVTRVTHVIWSWIKIGLIMVIVITSIAFRPRVTSTRKLDNSIENIDGFRGGFDNFNKTNNGYNDVSSSVTVVGLFFALTVCVFSILGVESIDIDSYQEKRHRERGVLFNNFETTRGDATALLDVFWRIMVSQAANLAVLPILARFIMSELFTVSPSPLPSPYSEGEATKYPPGMDFIDLVSYLLSMSSPADDRLQTRWNPAPRPPVAEFALGVRRIQSLCRGFRRDSFDNSPRGLYHGAIEHSLIPQDFRIAAAEPVFAKQPGVKSWAFESLPRGSLFGKRLSSMSPMFRDLVSTLH